MAGTVVGQAAREPKIDPPEDRDRLIKRQFIGGS
jgi:hypothetical protein